MSPAGVNKLLDASILDNGVKTLQGIYSATVVWRDDGEVSVASFNIILDALGSVPHYCNGCTDVLPLKFELQHGKTLIDRPHSDSNQVLPLGLS